jgi:hypothetical protein
MDVEIKLTGSGLQFESKVSLFQATQIMAFISRAEQANTPLSNGGTIDSSDASVYEAHTLDANSLDAKTIYESPHAAIAQTRAKTNPQKIVALAYYLGATSTNQRHFTTDEILACFKKAGESTPKNINRDFREAVAAGYVFQEEKGTYRLLSSVDSVQSEGFKKVAKKRATTSASGSQSKTKLVVRDEIKNMRISTSMDGHHDFFAIKSRADQILWVVEYTKTLGVDGVNRFEIIDFVKKVGGDITSKNFTASNVPNVKNGYIYSEQEVLRLTPKGQTQLKTAGDKAETK